MARKRRRRTPLGRYGFPSNQVLRRQALRLADASLPSPASVARPFDRSSGDVGGFTRALVALLRNQQGAGAAAFEDPIAQQERIGQAARERLGGLDFADADIAAGAASDSGLSRLLAGKASAGEYGARQPGIAASQGALMQTGLENAKLEALRQRDEALRSAFATAYQQVQAQALAMAQANAGLHFDEQRLALDWFNAQQREAGGPAAKKERQGVFYQAREQVFEAAEKLYEGKQVEVEPGLGGTGPGGGTRTKRPSYRQAFDKLWARSGPELVSVYGFPAARVRKMIREALLAAGFRPAGPGNRGRGRRTGPGPPYDWQ